MSKMEDDHCKSNTKNKNMDNKQGKRRPIFSDIWRPTHSHWTILLLNIISLVQKINKKNYLGSHFSQELTHIAADGNIQAIPQNRRIIPWKCKETHHQLHIQVEESVVVMTQDQ